MHLSPLESASWRAGRTCDRNRQEPSAWIRMNQDGFMLNDELQKEILKSIDLQGSIDKAEIHQIICTPDNAKSILNLSSGRARISTSSLHKFQLILSQPQSLHALNPFEIRCCLCREVISYPCWYYNVQYAVNNMHYFVHFDSSNSDKPTAKCYRRE